MNDWAITTQNLGRRFRNNWAVRDLELQVPAGTIFGLLGPNGAGKSTTIQMLMGLLPPTEGTISVLGIDPSQNDVAVRKRVGYVPENHGFYDWMRVDETIGLVAPYHQNWDWERCDALQKDFDLDGSLRIKELSKGMRAKLALLLALSFDPEMLVLDEPTGGLDPAARREFIESILGQYQESGKTILVSSHLLNEFAGLIDYVTFIKNGKTFRTCSTEVLHREIKRARLVFNGDTPSSLDIQGAHSIKKSGRETLITFDNFDPEQTPKELEKTGAKHFDIEDLTLEDIFVELVGK